jgi:hypothetical protein
VGDCPASPKRNAGYTDQGMLQMRNPQSINSKAQSAEIKRPHLCSSLLICVHLRQKIFFHDKPDPTVGAAERLGE